MSRVGKQPVTIPSGVNVGIQDELVKVTGSKGTLEQHIPELVTLKLDGESLIITSNDETAKSRANQGLIRSLVNNMVEGVSKGFKKQLEVEGVGFKVNVSGNTLKMALGFSHDVKYVVPADLTITNDSNTITIEGADKQRVGQISAEIRALRKPEPYKGKGIHYVGEQILRKAGKAAGAGE